MGRLALLVLLGVGVLVVGLNRDRLDPAVLDAWLSGFGAWAPAIYVAAYAVGTVLFAPGAIFALAGGAMFGPVAGTLFNLTGATIGAALAFLIARFLAGDWVARKAGSRLARLIRGVEAEGWRFVAFVRLVPIFPFNLSNYAFGLTRIPFLSYVVTSFFTMAPGALAYTWLGYAGREALGGDVSAIRYGVLALALLATIAFVPRLIRRLRGGSVSWAAIDDLHPRLGTADAPFVLDVRGADEFCGPHGHIPGAVNIPLDELDDRLDELAEAMQGAIIAVCRTDRRSAMAARLLAEAGARDVHVLRGGMVAWNEAGLTTQRVENAA